MKNINEILMNYNCEIEKTPKKVLNEVDRIIRNIKLSNECLNNLRETIREHDFPSIEEEIMFFKYQKPEVLGHLNFYATQLKYSNEHPRVIISVKKNYIYKRLKSIEARKKRNIDFFNYYTQNESLLDNAYFLRKNNQLQLFSNPFQLNKDPYFNTSQDIKAADVVSYKLITNFFKKELEVLKLKKIKAIIKEVKPAILEDLNWTGTKTELIELLYALNASGSIRNGNAEMKKLVDICKVLFNTDLGNIYKTFNEIKEREKDQTKFINKLKTSLEQKINSEK